MGGWWQHNIVDAGKLPLLLCSAAFVVTFLSTRVIDCLPQPSFKRLLGIVPEIIAVAVTQSLEQQLHFGLLDQGFTDRL